ncbi:MAG: primosomal protein N' [Mucinivorans sp.]
MLLDVIIPQSLPMDHLTYIYEGDAPIGARVVVPLGRKKQVVGIVCAKREECGTENEKKIRHICLLVDLYPIVNQQLIDLYHFISQYYITPIGGVVRRLLPAPIATTKFAPQERLLKNRHKKSKPTFATQPKAEISLTKDNTLLITENDPENHAQIIASLPEQDNQTTLVVVPTQFQAQHLAALLSRYGQTVVYHPKITLKKRADIFVALATATLPRFVVGTRSAVGLPFRNLGLVVVVNDYSFAYKSGSAPRYSGRDVAIVLASIHHAKCLVLSHAPSVETYFNATQMEQWAIEILNTNPENKKLRSIALEHGKELMSKYLQRRIGEELTKGRQIVIFQNRRGWASAMVCPDCGYTPSCAACGCSLTLHKASGVMLCHYCGHREPARDCCPVCTKHGQVALVAHGRGTERLAEQMSALFPAARLLRLDSDTAGQYNEIAEQFSTQKADIIVGTQMVIDKIDYTNVGIVAVADADNLLSVADFRASEQAFRHLYSLAQAARRVGAEMIVQTSSYNNPTIAMALSDSPLDFYKFELAHRAAAHYPPFSRLVTFDMRSADREQLFAIATGVERVLRSKFGEELSPLFQPQVERMGGEHIVKLLLKVDRSRSLFLVKGLIVDLVSPLIRRYFRVVRIEIIVDPL